MHVNRKWTFLHSWADILTNVWTNSLYKSKDTAIQIWKEKKAHFRLRASLKTLLVKLPIDYFEFAQETGSKFLPKNSPTVQFHALPTQFPLQPHRQLSLNHSARTNCQL